MTNARRSTPTGVFKLDNPSPVEINRIKFAFGDGSHHVHIYRSTEPEADGVSDCWKGINWPRWQLVVGAQTTPLDWALPDGLTVPLAPHQQLLVQVHWLNTSPAPIDGPKPPWTRWMAPMPP